MVRKVAPNGVLRVHRVHGTHDPLIACRRILLIGVDGPVPVV